MFMSHGDAAPTSAAAIISPNLEGQKISGTFFGGRNGCARWDLEEKLDVTQSILEIGIPRCKQLLVLR